MTTQPKEEGSQSMSDLEHERRRASDEEIDTIAERAATKAIQKNWLSMGVDISNPEGILELQADFRHMRMMRQVSSKMGSRAAGMVWTLVLGCALYWLLQKAGVPIAKIIGIQL